MKRFIWLTLIVLIFLVFAGCDDSIDKIKIPASSKQYEGRNYQEVLTELQEAGFTNIDTKKTEDLIVGWLTKDGEIEEIEVGGRTSFSSDSKFNRDVDIIITYHTFPEKEDKEEATNGNNDILDQAEKSDKHGKNEESPSTLPNNDGTQETILSIANNDDFFTILSIEGEIHDSYAEFAEKYKGCTIEFDAHISYIVNHKNYNTRYDILISASDWVNEDTAAPGPVFKFEDVSMTALGIKDLFIPSFLSVGKNIHVMAKIDKYNSEAGIFYLKPILLEER